MNRRKHPTPMKILRLAVVAVVLALSYVLWRLWQPEPPTATPPSVTTAPSAALEGELPAPQPDDFGGTSHETLPEIPENPTDREIAQSRVFGRTLVPLDGDDDAAENRAFGEFLRATRNLDADARQAAAKQWLADHDTSRWAASMRAEVALGDYQRGWFADARDGWQGLWDDLRERDERAARGLADEALGHLLVHDLGSGRAERLKTLLAQCEGRAHSGPLEATLMRAAQSVYLLEHVGAQNVMCGPMALTTIKDHVDGQAAPVSLNTVPASYIATGLPLSEVKAWAQEHYELPLTSAKRTDAAQPIPTPAVMHAKEDHYVALVEEDNGRYFLVDQARDFARWVDGAAVDAMSSGHFLIPDTDEALLGFVQTEEAETRLVFGRDGAHGTGPGDESSGPGDHSDGPEEPCPKGMPRHLFNLQLGGLIVKDIPLSYRTPYGSDFEFLLTYQEMDDSQPTTVPSNSHVGFIWQANVMAYVEHLDGALNDSTELRVHERRGGVEVSLYDEEEGYFGPNDKTFSVVRRTGAHTYERSFPDGVVEVYSVADNPAAPTKVFLRSVSDRNGNTLTFNYDAILRLTSVVDALGQSTTFSYGNPLDSFAITQVTDPHGRMAKMSYNADGYLVSVTDQVGLQSTFTYDMDGFMQTLTTPYGTTRFVKVSSTPGLERTIDAIDPNGDRERIQFSDPGPPIESIPPVRTISVGGNDIRFYSEYGRLQFRNSYYWSKEAWSKAPGDYTAAVNYRWMTNRIYRVLPVIEAIKPPLQGRTWYAYPGQESKQEQPLPYYPDMGMRPSMALTMVDETTPQLWQVARNRFGRILREVDPLGRSRDYTYADNELDVVAIHQTTNGMNERLAAMTYDVNRRLTSFIDHMGQTSSITYDSRGLITSYSNALGETVSFTRGVEGVVDAIDGPLPGNGDTYTFVHDDAHRVTQFTQPDGYVLGFAYDSMDRLTRMTFPDATFREWTYDRLAIGSFRDRAGRVSTGSYNNLGQLESLTDALGRKSTYTWCRCGHLRTLTDPMGRLTRWIYDLQGRVVAKELADGSRSTRSYHPTMGWIQSRRDHEGQRIQLSYDIVGMVTGIEYPGALHLTPSVSLQYGEAYGRLVSLTDGEGTTAFTYHPVTSTPSAGDGLLASEDGPWDNDTITYSYDALGRMVSRSIDGISVSATFDEANRITSITNPLGTFTPSYDGVMRRVSSIDLPGGGQSVFTYHGNTDDRRVSTIRHEAPGGALISEFAHVWNAPEDRLVSWTVTRGTGTAETWTFSHDAGGQLTGVTTPTGNHAYTYDAAGNRISETTPDGTFTARYNALNQLIEQEGLVDRLYEWDGEGRLIAVNEGTHRSEFTYDGRSRRTRIVEKENGAVTSDQRFLWAGTQLAEARSADGGTVTKRYFGQGEQVVAGGATSLYHRDHLQSVRDIANTAGSVGQTINYSPWGAAEASPASPAPSFAYTGLPLHGETGLIFAYFRTYQPQTGRFLSRDPLAELVGHNLYLYANNAPWRHTDRSGLWLGWDDAGAAAVGAGVGVAGQGLSDLWNGQLSGWEDYAGSAIGGAAGGVATLYTGPFGAGVVGGAGTNLAKQFLKTLTGKQCEFDWKSLGWDALAGGLGGKLGDMFKFSPFKTNQFGTFEQNYLPSVLNGLTNAGTPTNLAAGDLYNYANGN